MIFVAGLVLTPPGSSRVVVQLSIYELLGEARETPPTLVAWSFSFSATNGANDRN